jgi:hypothetical protein
MIVRIVIALFISLVSGVCYMAGLTRLMSGLLIFFGVISALFFGIVFLLPPGSDRISFTVTAHGSSWPFFLLAVILALMIGYLFLKKDQGREPAPYEPLGTPHLRFLGGGILLYVCSLFLPVLLWFPSEQMTTTTAPARLEIMLLVGVLMFIAGLSGALYLIYRSTRGGTPENPSLMKRFVPALFSVFHFDKIPALAAYLLIYSSQPQLVFPKIGALALAAYIPVAIFLIAISFSMDRDRP